MEEFALSLADYRRGAGRCRSRAGRVVSLSARVHPLRLRRLRRRSAGPGRAARTDCSSTSATICGGRHRPPSQNSLSARRPRWCSPTELVEGAVNPRRNADDAFTCAARAARPRRGRRVGPVGRLPDDGAPFRRATRRWPAISTRVEDARWACPWRTRSRCTRRSRI